ncbi:MAG: hypothetical protein NZ953_03715 [Thaumarchaeota archaeon]|nr:hypothetical protein [Candidatus Calditenuaceae archaeon]MDW8044087.1 hypothetical protein [Nitrososphaerota archaeon]
MKVLSGNPRNGLAVALQETVNELMCKDLKPKTVLFSHFWSSDCYMPKI